MSTPQPTGTPPDPRRFVLVFLGVLTLLLALSQLTGFERGVLEPYLAWNASLSASLLGLFGEPVRAAGAVVQSDAFAVEVRRGCDAYEPVAIFLSGIAAFPAALGARFAGALVGSLLLVLLNLLRIVTLFLLGQRAPEAFGLAHEGLWQALFILVALTLWILWARWSVRRAHALARTAEAAPT